MVHYIDKNLTPCFGIGLTRRFDIQLINSIHNKAEKSQTEWGTLESSHNNPYLVYAVKEFFKSLDLDVDFDVCIQTVPARTETPWIQENEIHIYSIATEEYRNPVEFKDVDLGQYHFLTGILDATIPYKFNIQQDVDRVDLKITIKGDYEELCEQVKSKISQPKYEFEYEFDRPRLLEIMNIMKERRDTYFVKPGKTIGHVGQYIAHMIGKDSFVEHDYAMIELKKEMIEQSRDFIRYYDLPLDTSISPTPDWDCFFNRTVEDSVLGWHIDKSRDTNNSRANLMFALNIDEPRAPIDFRNYGEYPYVKCIMDVTREHRVVNLNLPRRSSFRMTFRNITYDQIKERLIRRDEQVYF